jgi:hypothetical protein
MKIISWWMTPGEIKSGNKLRFIFSPYLSFKSFNYKALPGYMGAIRFVIFFLLTMISIKLSNHFIGPVSNFAIIIISPIIYFFTESIGAFGQLIFYSTPTFPIHRSPLLASNLSHFWGKDWNLWVQDWLRDVTQYFARGQRTKRIILVFLISGLFHELMTNLPYWIIYRKSYFGTMMAYFLIQALGLWLDKTYIRSWPGFWRKIYMWMVIIVPSPLFINVPLLTFLGIKHD